LAGVCVVFLWVDDIVIWIVCKYLGVMYGITLSKP